jgi:hypothetical protein
MQDNLTSSRGGQRMLSLIAVTVAALGSVGIMLSIASNTPPLLLILFLGWVISPFAALIFANIVRESRFVPARPALTYLTLFVAVVSPGVYAYVVFGPPRSTRAPVWLIVPGLSWLIIALTLASAAISARRDRSKS